MTETKFELRGLKSADLFPMFAILSKIGFKDLKESLSPEAIKEMITAVKSEEQDATTYIGFSVIMEAVEIIMRNLPSCEKEIYSFLAGLSGMKPEEIADLPPADFAEMIIAVLQKDEFKDFFKVVSRLFN